MKRCLLNVAWLPGSIKSCEEGVNLIVRCNSSLGFSSSSIQTGFSCEEGVNRHSNSLIQSGGIFGLVVRRV